jgi:hypothetical protein
MWSSIGQTARACRTLFPIADILALVIVASPGEAGAQARGTMTVRAQVVSAAPGQAGIDGTAELVRSRRPALDSATRAETRFAVVTLRWEGRGGRSGEGRVKEAGTDRPRLVASIQFLRN